ncbi:MAG: AI-2E family transporter [Thermoanaerobaculales bacterium]|jgi:predicted PurR-regulated permease PerM|nr:AI-2E family transporter [Thermoanaerobaculales bacterium]
MSLEFSERQQSTVAAAVTILAAVIIVGAIGLVCWVLGAFVNRFSNVFLPLAVAAVASLVFKPFYDWVRTKLKVNKIVALVFVFLAVVIPVAGLVFFFGALIVDQVSDMVKAFPTWWESAVDWVKTRAPAVDAFLRENPYAREIREGMEAQGGGLLDGLGSVGRQALTAGAGLVTWVVGLVGWAVFPIYFSFFLMADTIELKKLDGYLPFFKKETREDILYLLGEFLNIMVAFFRGQLVIASIQGALFAVGFSVVGLKYGAVIGISLGFLNIVPYLGNIVGLATALPIAFFQDGGGIGRVAAVLVVVALVQAIEGYLLTPKIMGDRTGLHPVVIIIAIFFWGSALGGISGMILAIPLTAFLVVFWRLAREKYMQELV